MQQSAACMHACAAISKGCICIFLPSYICFNSGVQVNMRTGGVESEANVTDIHEALHFDVMEERDSGYHHSFGIWSLRWGADGREIVAGTGDHSLYVYNMERQKVGALSGILSSLMSQFEANVTLCMPSVYFFLEPYVAADQASNHSARVTVALVT